MKKDIAEFVVKCSNCQNQRPGDLAWIIEILEWKWETINIYFITGLPRSRRQHDSIWTDGQAERSIQTIEDMLRACVINFKGNWYDHIPLVEFTYNNNYHSRIQMAPYEALYKCLCDPSLIVPTENFGIKDNLSHKEIPVQILDRQVWELRTKEVASIKVLWRNKFVEEETWEAEEEISTSLQMQR
ncbi:uncharacterized protein [Solanum lycopersicum]|uniref:uncharacterized protein n=1 Tax=Solanum lycopersicum TaxID=4081 RepID=UPI003749CC6A